MNINEDIIKNVINVDTSINNKSRVNFIKGKNLLDVSNQSTRADNGVTLTVNGDGTFTLNGTATANTTFSISSGITLKAGTYTASGVSGGSSSTYYYGILQNNSWVFRNYNGSDTFTVSSNTTYSTILIVVGNGTTVSNVTISPMIQKGSSASTYEPYVAPSIVVDNETIYEKVEHKIFKKTVTASGWSAPLKLEDYNGYDFITFYITSSDFKDIITLPIDVLKLRITNNAYTITSNNKQYMSVGMYDTSIMLYRGYADSIEIILWK